MNPRLRRGPRWMRNCLDGSEAGLRDVHREAAAPALRGCGQAAAWARPKELSVGGWLGHVTRPIVEPEVMRTIHIVTVAGRRFFAAVAAFVKADDKHRWPALTTGPKDKLQAASWARPGLVCLSWRPRSGWHVGRLRSYGGASAAAISHRSVMWLVRHRLCGQTENDGNVDLPTGLQAGAGASAVPRHEPFRAPTERHGCRHGHVDAAYGRERHGRLRLLQGQSRQREEHGLRRRLRRRGRRLGAALCRGGSPLARGSSPVPVSDAVRLDGFAHPASSEARRSDLTA